MNGAGVDTYIDAVQSKGKFAVVAEKVKETAAAAGKDVVVRVESKVEKLEEKLKVATEKDPILSTSGSISSSMSTDRAAGALAATSADAKAAPAVKLATTERPGVTPPVETAVKPATGKVTTDAEKAQLADKKAEPGKPLEASTAAGRPANALRRWGVTRVDAQVVADHAGTRVCSTVWLFIQRNRPHIIRNDSYYFANFWYFGTHFATKLEI